MKKLERGFQSMPLLSLHILLLTLLATPAPARAASWLENVSFRVQVGGKPTGTAHVYDSGDYQRMLLVLEERPHAYILDLAAATVYRVPRDSVRISDEGSAEIGKAATEYAAALDKKDGTLLFAVDDASIAIEPLPPLIGPATLEKILQLKPSYQSAAQKYKPDPAKVAILKGAPEPTEVRVFFGTWCLLCKRLLPGMIRTFELAANPKISVSYVGVDEDLRQPEAEIQKYSVTRTPTIIVLRSGREIGRIEEKASTTVEADLAAILGPRGH